MKLIRGRVDNARSEQRDSTFTGQVWADPLAPAAGGVALNTVYFSPGSRTYWHRHEGGQLLHVTSGAGWVALRSEAPEPLREGDTVWAPPGEEHWHGAQQDALLVHLAVSHGPTEWLEEVTESDYRAR